MVIALHWKQGVNHRALSLGDDQVHLQLLASFILDEWAQKWWDSLWLGEKKLTTT